MKSPWLIAGLVTLTGHGALAAWLVEREPSAHPPLPRTVVRFKVTTPPVEKKEIEPPARPPEPPPPPPPPKRVKRVRPKPAPSEPPPEGPTKTDIVDPAESGLSPDQSASQGAMVVQGGGGIDGAIQEGHGSERTRVAEPPPPRPPAPRRFVPIFQVTRMPRPIRAVQPEVPEAFRSQNREAVVVVEVAISASGRVVDARVVKKAGFGLDEAAIAAARRTAFEPAMQGDRPVAVKMQIPYRFKVRG
jgi:protein TonB